MSDAVPGDYVDTGMSPPPRLPPSEYRPTVGEALERLYASHAKRMEEWSGYAAARGRDIATQSAQTQLRIAARRRARDRGR